MSISNWKVQSMKQQIMKWRGIADQFKNNNELELYRKATQVADEIYDLVEEGKGYEDSGNTFVKSLSY